MRKITPLSFHLLNLMLVSLTFSLSEVSQANTAIAPKPKKEWTFLTFLNGYNNLDSYGKLNINQMEKFGSTDKLNIVVQWASQANKKTQRLYVIKDNNTNNVSSPSLQDLPGVDMGDWRSLVDFIQWGVTNFPAKHYFINVWDHGSGWHLAQARGSLGALQIHPLDISFDDNTGHSISTEQLGQAMQEAARIIGHKVDVYASDACMMAMVEVANEMAGSVSVFGGSEETEPGAGWPYDALLARWNALPESTPAQVATYLTEEYVKAYTGGQYGNGGNATFSAYNMDELPRLNNSIAKLAHSLSTVGSAGIAEVTNAAASAQTYTYSDYADLGDFVRVLNGVSVADVDASALADVQGAMEHFVIASGASPDLKKSTGISIWLPNSKSDYDSYADRYQKLKFDQSTHWSDALRAIAH